MMEIVEANPNVDITPYGIPMLITLGYSLLQYTFIGFGVYSLVKMIKQRRIYLLNGEITLEKGTYVDVILKNPGVIVYYVFCAVIMITNLIPTAEILEPEVITNGAEVIYNLLRTVI